MENKSSKNSEFGTNGQVTRGMRQMSFASKPEDLLKYLDHTVKDENVKELGKALVSHPSFEYDSDKDLSAIMAKNAAVFSQRSLLDGLTKHGHDKKDFLAWIDNSSNFSSSKKSMVHNILDNWTPSKVESKKGKFKENTELTEAISLESDLLMKLNPLSEAEIFEFMKNLRGGTYFNMGMYSSIPVSKAYKSTIRIYKVIDLTAIVSGVSYENVGTTKDFRDRTGKAPGNSWYDHTPGYENKIGQKKSDPNSKYVLWDIKRGTSTCVRYYVVDIDTGAVTPVTKVDVENSPYLTASEKAKLTPKPVEGFDKTTGDLIENKTNWRVAAFEHIFWLSQSGAATQEYGTRFEEDFSLTEAFSDELFIDANAHVMTDLDAILSGEVSESMEKSLNEDADIFLDANAGVRTKLDDVLSGQVAEAKELQESYRRTISRGNTLVDNELFVDFD